MCDPSLVQSLLQHGQWVGIIQAHGVFSDTMCTLSSGPPPRCSGLQHGGEGSPPTHSSSITIVGCMLERLLRAGPGHSCGVRMASMAWGQTAEVHQGLRPILLLCPLLPKPEPRTPLTGSVDAAAVVHLRRCERWTADPNLAAGKLLCGSRRQLLVMRLREKALQSML